MRVSVTSLGRTCVSTMVRRWAAKSGMAILYVGDAGLIRCPIPPDNAGALQFQASALAFAHRDTADSRFYPDGTPSKLCLIPFAREGKTCEMACGTARGSRGLDENRAAQFRRPRRTDRTHASHLRRRKTLDRRDALSACAQFLHVAAGAGGAATRDLYRLAHRRCARRHRGWHVVRGSRR